MNLPATSQEVQNVPQEASSINNAERVTLENERLQAEITDLKLLTDLRKDYASKVFTFLVWWTIGVAGIIALSGFKIDDFVLPESALTALIGSTTISAIGLVGFIVQGLFKTK
ncbi:MAG: hypothetical protein P9L92_20015 [Candidatus Electryonea clarkiae]|nr:hypothetical protein [Candidatus Electryonea clarkiae]MDP8288837.1 hypothetical protein [Candidatus Electryonea clarkiae]